MIYFNMNKILFAKRDGAKRASKDIDVFFIGHLLELFTSPHIISGSLGNVVKHMDCVVDCTVSATITELKGQVHLVLIR